MIPLGSVVATPAALRFCALHNIDILSLVSRHASGDWGNLDADDIAANRRAVKEDLRVFSSYRFDAGKVWVITEWNREHTTVMLPSEY